MPDQEEVEVKFVVSDPEATRAALRRAGAIFKGKHFEDNIRIDDAAGSLTARRMVLRVRGIEEGGRTRTVLTVKSPLTAADPDVSRRREIETEVGDGPAMLAALAALGYEPVWRYEKRRETFQAGEVIIDLDELPYGWFLELEGPPDGIRAAAARLGLDMAEGLTISYKQIFENVRRAMRLTMKDLTFEAFEGIRVDPAVYRG